MLRVRKVLLNTRNSRGGSNLQGRLPRPIRHLCSCWLLSRQMSLSFQYWNI